MNLLSNESPMHILDDLIDIPHFAFEDGNQIAEMVGSIMNDKEFFETLSKNYYADPDNFQKELLDLKQKKEKLMSKNKDNEIIISLFQHLINICSAILISGGHFNEVEMKVLPLFEDVILPKYGHIMDSGADIFSYEDIVILPQSTEKVSTGLKIIVPGGYEVEIRPRSGLSTKTALRIPNSPATIDAGYRGELLVPFWNPSDNQIVIRKGDRIAQMFINERPKIKWVVVNTQEFNMHLTERGDGFGSSGV